MKQTTIADDQVQHEFDFQKYLQNRKELVEAKLDSYLSGDDPAKLWQAMRYSALSSGKRIRAILCLAAAEAAMGKNGQELALPCACAIELLHAFSLIHDDLPSMDNDDMRRGLPTNHKVYGEAMAILSGDALFAHAIEIMTKTNVTDPNLLLEVVQEFAKASGALGLVGGQVLDLCLTGDPQLADLSLLSSMHKRKTGALIRFSVWSGAKIAQASKQTCQAMNKFGEILGLAFQIADDLLDVTGNVQLLGKTPGKDKALCKATWVNIFGVEESRKRLIELKQEGEEALSLTGYSNTALQPLRSLLEYSIYRNK